MLETFGIFIAAVSIGVLAISPFVMVRATRAPVNGEKKTLQEIVGQVHAIKERHAGPRVGGGAGTLLSQK